jgi:signal recognition particle receptor subunit beta
MMEDNLKSYGLDPKKFPSVLQYNKRDLADAVCVGSLEEALKLNGVSVKEAVATEGRGVMETIREVSTLVIQRFEL